MVITLNLGLLETFFARLGAGVGVGIWDDFDFGMHLTLSPNQMGQIEMKR